MKHLSPNAFARAKPATHRVFASPELVALIDRVNANFEAFKAENDTRLKEVEKNKADPLTAEKVERINNALTADITAIKAELAAIAEIKAALGQGGGAPNVQSAAQREHTQAFNEYFRRGTEAGLRELEVKAGLTSTSGPDGGYLIPDEWDKTIDRVLTMQSAMRRIATVQPVGSATYKKWVNVGGASSGWTNSSKTKTETNTPKLEKYEFPVHEIYAFPFADNSTLDDALIDLEAWMSGEVDIEFARAEGDAWINGDGDGMPRGLLTYTINLDISQPSGVARAAGALGYVPGGSASALDKSDSFIKLYHALKAGYRAGATWLMNDLTAAAVRQLKDAYGQYIWQTDFSSDQPFTLLGKSIETDDNMPVIGANSYSVAFGNFKSGYLITDRKGTSVLRDPLTVKGKTGFYTTKRVGGGVQNFEAIKLLKTATS